MYYENPIVIEEKTATGISDGGWVKVADTLDFDINEVKAISFRNSEGQIFQDLPVKPTQEGGQTCLIIPGMEGCFGIYVTPEEVENSWYNEPGFYLWGGDDGEEVEVSYSFILNGDIHGVDAKYLQNSNIINGTGKGSLEMSSDWEWNKAQGKCSMAIGERTLALAEASFASGHESRVNEDAWCGHAEGRGVEVSGLYAHAENFYTEAIGESSHAEGGSSMAVGDNSHAEGWYSEARGKASHSENYSRAFGDYSHAEGLNTFAGGEASHAEGKAVISSGYQSSISGEANALNYITSKNNSNIVPGETVVTLYRNNGHKTHASAIVETYNKTTGAITVNRTLSEDEAVDGTAKFQIRGAAFGDYSHIEGYGTQALGQGAHAEGIVAEDLVGSIARGDGSHIEGVGTETGADGYGAHAEGFSSKANGWASHAEGQDTIADGPLSHVEGYRTIASSEYQHVQGKSNIKDQENQYAHIVGNGTGAKDSNAHTLDWSGNAWYSGDVYVGSTSGTNKDEGSKKLATEEYVNNNGTKVIFRKWSEE